MWKLCRSVAAVAVVCVVIVSACGGGDDDSASKRDDGPSSSDPGDDGGGESTDGVGSEGGAESGGVPDVDVCSLAADTIRAIFFQVMGQEPTVERSTDPNGRSQCEWSGAGSRLELTVAVSTYDDSFFDHDVQQAIDATPVPGLGDEAYMTEAERLSWRRDDFSVHLDGFPVDEVVAIAQEIDGQMPAT